VRNGQRQGGMSIDPGVKQWVREAPPNLAALTAKQRQDRARVRVKYDLKPELKAAIEQAAEAEETSSSQLAGFLLSWAMRAYRAGDAELRAALKAGKSPARTPRVSYNLEFNGDNGGDF